MATTQKLAVPTEVTEQALAGRLRGLSKADLKAFAGHINEMATGGFKPDDVFPIGIIINNPDGAEVRGHVLAKDIGELVKLIPTLKPRSVSIFPRGIVVTDNFRVHVRLNGGG